MLKSSMDSFVLSSRVRLARNLSGARFISTMKKKEAESILYDVTRMLESEGFEVVRLADLNDTEIEALKERHLVSTALIRNRAVSALARRRGSDISVMINEEDHLRIQCIKEGLELSQAYDEVNALDDAIENTLPSAYDPEFGYLTACPTNLGTGMRAGVMMFLPGLHLTGGIGELARSGMLSHMTFRGVYGEGSEAEGFFYQLSNRHTLGISEQEILQEVKEDIDSIAAREERAREELYESETVLLTDKIYRAWGSLTNSYLMPSKEYFTLLALVKLGVCLGLIKLSEPRTVDRLMIECRPANLAAGQTLSAEKTDLIRAEKLRTVLTPLKLT